MVPPQVNKYYALDLSHGRSMYEYLLQHGIQVFTISWRNPTGAQRDWNFDTYAQAVIEAIDVISQVSGSPDVNIMGGCLGGMTAAIVQAHLAALGERRINSATMTVTMLDCDSDGRMFLFASPATLALAKAVSKPRGVIEGWQLGRCSPGCARTTWCGTTGRTTTCSARTRRPSTSWPGTRTRPG